MPAITLPDGKAKDSFAQAVTVAQVAADIGPGTRQGRACRPVGRRSCVDTSLRHRR
jgi:hypothetical protein